MREMEKPERVRGKEGLISRFSSSFFLALALSLFGSSHMDVDRVVSVSFVFLCIYFVLSETSMENDMEYDGMGIHRMQITPVDGSLLCLCISNRWMFSSFVSHTERSSYSFFLFDISLSPPYRFFFKSLLHFLFLICGIRGNFLVIETASLSWILQSRDISKKRMKNIDRFHLFDFFFLCVFVYLRECLSIELLCWLIHVDWIDSQSHSATDVLTPRDPAALKQDASHSSRIVRPHFPSSHFLDVFNVFHLYQSLVVWNMWLYSPFTPSVLSRS